MSNLQAYPVNQKKRKEKATSRKKEKVKKSNVWTKPMCKCTRAFLSIKQLYFLSSVFSPF